ncbi:hypothetical protein MKW92_025765, partial [Papaver armeniacum]
KGSKAHNSHCRANKISSSKTVSALDSAVVKLQKIYKSYRSQTNLADCAVVVEEI